MPVLLIVWLLCGIACALIAQSKNRSVAGFFFLGLLLGIIGLIIAACSRSAVAHSAYYAAPALPAPAGWFPDPYGSGGLRWFDGHQWGPQTAPAVR